MQQATSGNIGWPPPDLQFLDSCPVCGGRERSLRFKGLRDTAFRVAPGEWDLYRCEQCRTHYLDPRPDEASIGRAYGGYYTHAADQDVGYFWRSARWKDRLKTAYLNRQYGYAFPSSLPFGSLAVRARRSLRLSIDYQIRHLPAPPFPGAALLDVGAGSGTFLATAAALGFSPVGIDTDPKAVAVAQAAGLDIRLASLDDLDLRNRFAHVTISHTLEHLHWPRAALQRCAELLEPGGRIWISLPNLDAPGLVRFGESWRGLEAPRHLTLYDFASLRQLLALAGLVDVRLLPSDEPAHFYFRQSEAMSAGVDPYRHDRATSAIYRAAEAANACARRDPRYGESITVTARRPR